ncbi:hypothetical protein EVAR_95339_1 [Eumeta japonica]|uniref:Uncharacterized protein n=1 Tax=Eumeta variegata TaxID=151549 RepID=A0A4C1U9E2_EUMVA|nr:hypothetical protein EVAR_95339_1 [Eumeta japonica]
MTTPLFPHRLMPPSMFKPSARRLQTLLSRASQDDGWLATVSDAPLPLHFIGGASVAHDTEQPSPQLTPARRSSKWDAAERHQSSRRPPHEPGCQDPEVIGEALTRAPVCRPEEHVVVKVARCGSAAGAPDQEVVRREASASAGSTSTSVNGLELTMCSASAAGCGELLREGSLSM